MIRLIIAAVVVVGIWVAWSVWASGVEPEVANQIALQQMDNTTEGHVASRTYFNSVQSWAQSPVTPLLASLVVIGLAVLTRRRKSPAAPAPATAAAPQSVTNSEKE